MPKNKTTLWGVYLELCRIVDVIPMCWIPTDEKLKVWHLAQVGGVSHHP